MDQRRPASVTFPLPGSPVFFGAGITTNRPQSSLSGRRSRSSVSSPLLSNEQQYHSYDNDNDDDIESRQGKDEDKPTKMIRNKKDLLILIALCLSYYNAFCAFSMIAPILPNEVCEIIFPCLHLFRLVKLKKLKFKRPAHGNLNEIPFKFPYQNSRASLVYLLDPVLFLYLDNPRSLVFSVFNSRKTRFFDKMQFSRTFF